MDLLIFSFDGMGKYIESLKVSSWCGVHNISSKFLKGTKVYSAMFLSMIFEQSLFSSNLS